MTTLTVSGTRVALPHATPYERVLHRLAAALATYAAERGERRAQRRDLELARTAADEDRARRTAHAALGRL